MKNKQDGWIFLDECFYYLWLCSKIPQNLVAENNKHYLSFFGIGRSSVVD